MSPEFIQKEKDMTAKLNPFAAAPALMKHWMTVSVAAAQSLEPMLI